MKLQLKKSIFLPEFLGFIAIYLFLIHYCAPHLIFSNTMLTGGDSISWLQPMEHLRNVLLPHGRFMGWSLANFFGYNEGQYYFPIPFVTGALLSYLIPATIALKIITLTGIFALPATFFFTARRLFSNRWVQLSAPALSLLFLFNESYSMFGGNFLSTLAGEFCYSWAISFFVLFIGSLWKTFTNKSNPIPAGIFLALMAPSHIFVFMVAFLLPIFFVFTRKDESTVSQIVFRIAIVYGFGLAGSAFWMLPMAATRVWSATIPMFWHFNSMAEFFYQTRFPVVALGILICIVSICRRVQSQLASFFLFGIGSCIFYYITSSFLEIPDIRFVPPALVLSLFVLLFLAQIIVNLFALRLHTRVKNLRPWMPTLIVYGICFFLCTHEARNLRAWFHWNYEGIEAKKQAAILPYLKKQFGESHADGRFLWEKPNQNDSADFGSERIFENLFHFTGRGTSEGVNYGSSFMARASTYLQSEYSLDPVDPEAERIYSIVNPEVWPIRFAQLNARNIIVFSDKIKALFTAHSDFQKSADYGKFAVFTYKKFRWRYTEVLPDDALSLVKDSSAGFKTDLYRYFRDYDLIRHPFVPLSFADIELKNKLPLFNSYNELFLKYQKSGDYKNWEPDSAPIKIESISDLSIKFTTTAIGKPHLIKICYSPNFKSISGEKIYPVSPGFMLIYPSKRYVEIRFKRSLWEIIGILLTLLCIPIGLWIAKQKNEQFPYPIFFQYTAITIFLAGLCIILACTFGGMRKDITILQNASELAFKSPEKNQQALDMLQSIAIDSLLEEYDNQFIVNAFMLKARLLSAMGRKSEASSIFKTLESRYMHSRFIEGIKGVINPH